MSYGIVVCAGCLRELHQDGPREVENGWRHCEDKSPRCPGALAAYPESRNEIIGRYCGKDDPEASPPVDW